MRAKAKKVARTFLALAEPLRNRTALARTVWYNAACSGNVVVIRDMLSRGPRWIEQRGHWGRTALWQAAAHGHAEVVSTLLAAGASPELGDNLDGSRPLHAAVFHGHVCWRPTLATRACGRIVSSLLIAAAEAMPLKPCR